MSELSFANVTEPELAALAGSLAPRLRPGDFLALHGELGAGKTAFARALIRALLSHPAEEVPSPTFALVQPYDSARFPIAHYDFYRLTDPAEADELGLDDALAAGLVIAEWPERLGARLPSDRLDIRLGDGDGPATRNVVLQARGIWSARLERFAAAQRFIAGAGWAGAQASYVNGDASARSYVRLAEHGRTAILMDWAKAPDGPPIRDGLPYSRIAHLAEEVTPFVAVANALREAGLAAPEIYAVDLGEGFLLIQDFGDAVFTRLAGEGADMLPLYRLAVDGLLALRRTQPPAALPIGGGDPLGAPLHPAHIPSVSGSGHPNPVHPLPLDGGHPNPAHISPAGGGAHLPSAHPHPAHILPVYDRDALAIETELLVDWFLPALRGAKTPPDIRESFAALWQTQFDWLLAQPSGWLLRDYHSPNLVLRPGQGGLERLGILDFQDAMRGHLAFDLVSLLQDARLDLPPGLEAELFGYYCDGAAAQHSGFDKAAFIRAYHLLGAQRNTKILGIFARLARRDGKRAYLQHMPRVARYLASDLQHSALAALKSWYDRELPGDIASLTARF